MKVRRAHGAKAAAALLALATLAACGGGLPFAGNQPAAPAAPPAHPSPPPLPPPPPPPVDMSGRWKLTAASGGACLMNFGAQSAAAAQGSIAPEGGCPGSFFTSRKWLFEHGTLIMRNHKGEPLARLSFAGGHFEGQETGGAASGASVSLSR